MKKVSVKYLSQEDVLRIGLSCEDVIMSCEKAIASHGKKQVEMPPKPGIHTRKGTFIHAMPSWLKDQDICGMKWVSGYPENYKYDLPAIAGLLVLNDPETGMPYSVMDCRWITAIRTAAVTAVTAKYCAPSNATTLTIIGAGVQGRFNAVMLKKVIPGLKKIYAYDIKEIVLKQYVKDMTEKLGIDIIPITNIEEAVRKSDVILTATQYLEKPIISKEWLKPGILGFGLENSRAWDGNAILSMKFITDDWGQIEYYAKHNGAFPAGIPQLHALLGEIVTGQKPGRENNDERIMAINLGMSVVDIALAKKLYDKATDEGIGIELPLMEQDILI